MRVLLRTNRLYGSVVLLCLVCLAPQVWGQEGDENRITVHRERVGENEMEKVHSQIRETLTKRLDIFEPEMELGRLIECIAAKLDLPIVFDPLGLEEVGVTKDIIVSHNIKGVSGKSALKLILKPLALTYVIENEVLEITSIEAAAKRLRTKVYNCRDLLALVPKVPVTSSVPGLGGGKSAAGANEPQFSPEDLQREAKRIEQEEAYKAVKEYTFNGDKFTMLVTNALASRSWNEDGGNGSISEFDGLIVIKQTEEVHEQIEQLLASMREAVKRTPAK